MKTFLAAIVALLISVSSNTVFAADWNQFRGPAGDGKTTIELPTEFSETQNVRWKIAIPDQGWSSPVIWGNEVWVTTGSDESRELRAICVDLESGKILKDIKVFEMIDTPVMKEYIHHSPHLNSPATPTAVIEEGRIYVHFGSQGIACLDTRTGKKLWERRDLNCYQPVRQGSSPIVDDERVFVAYDGLDKQFFVALDKQTGETSWIQNRNVETDPEVAAKIAASGKPGDTKKAFATAQLIDVDGQTQLIAPGAEATMAYDPKTGDELWRVHHEGGFNVAARPLYAHGMIYIFTSGMTGYLMGVRVDGAGDVTDTHIGWSTTRGTPHIPSPVIVDDLMFLVTNRGVARCLDAKTGDEVWKARLGGEYWASPLYADGMLYFSNKDGEIKVFPATREKPAIRSHQLNASFIASPAVADDSILVRSTTHLYRLQNGYTRTAAEVAADTPAKIAKKNGKAAGKLAGKSPDIDKLAQQLKQAVDSGKLTAEQAKAKYDAIVARANQKPSAAKGASKAKGTSQAKGKGKRTKRADGRVQFYSMVIGTLKSKDVDLGEFTMEVDYILAGKPSINERLIGKTVQVTGVSGPFRDKLLMLRRGKPMKFRSGSYHPDSNSLGFGYKFHVLEAAQKFSPEDYGVPPKAFRGFSGILEGTITEIGGYEVLMRVNKVVELSDDSSAEDPDSIQDKLIRIADFFDPHVEVYNELNPGDTIRLSVVHRRPDGDVLNVTDRLEQVSQ